MVCKWGIYIHAQRPSAPPPPPQDSGHTWSSEGCTTHSSHHGGLPGRGLSPGRPAPLVAGSTHTASSGPATGMGNRESAVTKLQQEQHFQYRSQNPSQKPVFRKTLVWVTDSYCGQRDKEENSQVREANGLKACWNTAGFRKIQCGQGHGSSKGAQGKGTPAPVARACVLWGEEGGRDEGRERKS